MIEYSSSEMWPSSDSWFVEYEIMVDKEKEWRERTPSTPRTNLKLTQDIISENVPEILIDDSMSDFVSPKFAPEWTLSG